MSTLRKAAQQALEALETLVPRRGGDEYSRAASALRAALAQHAEPAPPYAWMAVGGTIWRHKTREDDVPLYTAPLQRKPLTEEELEKIMTSLKSPSGFKGWWWQDVARAIERAHGIGGDDGQA